MILSEKELERMVGEALGAACPEKVAAHAIAEKLAKGVVFRDMAYAGQVGNNAVGVSMSNSDVTASVTFYGPEAQRLRGKQMTVTVTTKEEDGGPEDHRQARG